MHDLKTSKRSGYYRFSENPLVGEFVTSFDDDNQCLQYCLRNIAKIKASQKKKQKIEDKIFGSFLLGLLKNTAMWLTHIPLEEFLNIKPQGVIQDEKEDGR